MLAGSNGLPKLQWGRGKSAAEATSAAVPLEQLGWLQWGRG